MLLGELVLVIVAMVLMIISLGLIVVPSVPVSALEWTIALVVAVLTNFQRVTPSAVVVISLLAIVGSTSGLWLPVFGLRGKSLSCGGFMAFFVGFFVGSAVIPIPIIGGFIGSILAVILVEYVTVREIRTAFQRGGVALKLTLMSMAVEFAFAVLIVITFMLSIGLTA